MRLVVVSNRVARPSAKPSAGGLAVGLEAALKAAGGLWFGWSGEIAERSEPDVEMADGYAVATTDLAPAEYEGYYHGFANRALWPAFHNRLDLTTFDARDLEAYYRVNHVFAERLLPLLRPDDTVWVHDYHLIPLGRILRESGVVSPIGFFLHTPFPPAEVFTAMRWYAELAGDLCRYDLVGLQSQRDYWNFCDLIEHELGGATTADGEISLGERTLRVGVFPISIDADRFAELAGAGAVRRFQDRLSHRFEGCRLIIGVDRLDYTKGLVERFAAFETLLRRFPEYRKRVAMLQIAAPSRQDVPEYETVRLELEAIVGRINGRLSDIDWVPIRYINKSFGHARIAALYRLARVGLVTPLRDGMNLVAKEFVAAQDAEDPGVLVLSRFAGSADRMTGPILVSPYDTDAVAEAIRQALEMPLEDRRDRWETMFAELRSQTVHDWWRQFLAALASAAAEPAVV